MAFSHLDCSSVEQLRNARTYGSQSAALRALKNETVGHVLKKECCVEAGVLRPIVQVLLRARPAGWEDTAHALDPGQPKSLWLTEPQLDDLSAKDQARLHALELLVIFAGGGPAFLAPLHAAGALQALVMYIDPQTIHTRLVYAALRAISAITKAAKLVSASDPARATELPAAITLQRLADALFSAAPDGGPLPTVLSLNQIISLTPQLSWWTEAISNTAMELVGELCREPAHQAMLARVGMLDALANKMASYVVAQGLVVPGADLAAEKEGLRDVIPAPASPGLDMTAVLAAASAIIGDSRLHACLLLSAPPILAIFPQLAFNSRSSDIQAAWRALDMSGLSNLSPGQPLGALDMLLPAVPSHQSRSFFVSHIAAFPPLGMSLSRDNLPALGREGSGSEGGGGGGGSGNSSSYTADIKQRMASGSGPIIWGHSGRSANDSAEDPGPALVVNGSDAEDAESPMVPWLIGLVRSSSGLQRVAAASVLTALYRTGFTSRSRGAALALLIVPVLLQVLDDTATAAAQLASSSSSSRTGLASKSKKAGSSGGGGAATAGEDRQQPHKQQQKQQEQQVVGEAALTVLARLVANSEVLQKAAVDCKALPILARLLKESYMPVSTRNVRPWNPTPRGSARATPMTDADSSNSSHRASDAALLVAAASKLGPEGLSPLLAHRIRLREGVLRVVTALVATKDDHKRKFVGEEVLSHVVASLSPTPARPRNPAKDKTGLPLDEVEFPDTELDPAYGCNPVGVLVAACNCVRMLSRSIAVLRTDLEDADVAPYAFRLMQHPDVDVRTAATALMCNLLTETSPMRKRFAEAGIMHILCEHAHSDYSALRLNAMWALKHFVDGAEIAMKKACLGQLGSGWLVHLIDPDGNEDTAPAYFTRSRVSNMGITGAVKASTVNGDVVMDGSDDENGSSSDGRDGSDEKGKDVDEEEGGNGGDGANNEEAGGGGRLRMGTSTALSSPVAGRRTVAAAAAAQQTSHERSQTGRLRMAAARVSLLREQERRAPRKSTLDDAVIQEQGLNFIRNLIGPGPYSSSDPSVLGVGSGSLSDAGTPVAPSPTAMARDTMQEATDMIDYLFDEIGQERLFGVLLANLRAVVGGAGMVLMQQQVRIVEAVVFVLVHMSASVPRHKQVVVAQTEVLRALVGQFGSQDKGVLVALCHLMTNLTCCEEVSDRAATSARTMELKRLGLLAKLQLLQEEEDDPEVKEQAKIAMDQMVGAAHGNF